jgi:hypothetical protein
MAMVVGYFQIVKKSDFSLAYYEEDPVEVVDTLELKTVRPFYNSAHVFYRTM